ncbi:hypothetical protein [Pseudomonas putida]|uniref:Uncharacterized protein n=1 Tax=Pseudomonas putida TaxID=303 RepID=A0A8I1EAF0_PSEPU|nr:hypothetical protein [Pseudomonas putida]MBI6882327.1 hypothetical protein [Pseudomonas putida]
MKSLEKSTHADFLASGVRSITSAIPVAGGLISELLVSIIPNQRIDRISDYVEMLSERIEELGSSININEEIDKIGVVEQSFIVAAKTRSRYKLDKISRFVASSIADGDLVLSTDSILLDVLDSMTEDEIRCLESISSFEPYRNEHYKIFLSKDDEDKFERQRLINTYSYNMKYNLIEESLVSRKLISETSCSFEITEKGKLLLLKIS